MMRVKVHVLIFRCVALVFIPDEEDANVGKCIHHIRDWARSHYKSEFDQSEDSEILVEKKKCKKRPDYAASKFFYKNTYVQSNRPVAEYVYVQTQLDIT
jgi:hypothetical protein